MRIFLGESPTHAAAMRGGMTKIDVILRGGEKMKSSMILKTANQYLVTSFTKFFFKVQIVGPTKNIA